MKRYHDLSSRYVGIISQSLCYQRVRRDARNTAVDSLHIKKSGGNDYQQYRKQR